MLLRSVVVIAVAGVLGLAISPVAAGDGFGETGSWSPGPLYLPVLAQGEALNLSRLSYATDRILVKFQHGTTGSYRKRIHDRLGGSELFSVSAIGWDAVRVDDPVRALGAYRREAGVVWAEADFLRDNPGQSSVYSPGGASLSIGALPLEQSPNDPLLPRQWHLAKTHAATPWGRGAFGEGTVVAIIDTGVACSEPDLAGRCRPGWDYIDNDSDASPGHSGRARAHGTHVAGIVVANIDNAHGGAGGAPRAHVMPLRVCTGSARGGCFTSLMMRAVCDAVDLGADVMNMSIGGYGYSHGLADAVWYAHTHGVTVVASAGNDGTDAPAYPAAYESVVAVAATDEDDRRASWSNHGRWIDLAAPGVDVLSTVIGGYETWSGTSMAAPLVAGYAAILRGENSARTPQDLETLLESASVDLGAAGFDTLYGAGRVDMGIPRPTPTSPPAPTPSPESSHCPSAWPGVDDPEPNDDRHAAVELCEQVHYEGHVWPAGDPSDWFRIEVPDSGILRLTSGNEAGRYLFALHPPTLAGTLVGRILWSGFDCDLELEGWPAGQYFIEVSAPYGAAEQPYGLWWDYSGDTRGWVRTSIHCGSRE